MIRQTKPSQQKTVAVKARTVEAAVRVTEVVVNLQRRRVTAFSLARETIPELTLTLTLRD